MSQPKTYEFPDKFLKKPVKKVRSFKSIILVSCGSFNPITSGHLRMFESARDYLQDQYKLDVLGGYISPVHDGYGKVGLISSKHRVKLIQYSLESSDWIQLDTWEVEQSEYTRTKPVLEHFANCVKEKFGENADDVRVALLCGADLLESMIKPGVWKDVDYILGNHGVVCLERAGTNIRRLIFDNPTLNKYANNILLVPQFVQNDVSSTKIRLMVKRDYSTKYLIEDKVREYIETNNLYKGDAKEVLSEISLFTSPIDKKE